MSGEVELGRVLDPAALDVAEGPRARLRVQVPVAWSAARGGLEVTVPKRFTCARCDGGGCDACERSGAIRVPPELVGSRLRVPLSGRSGSDIQIRLAHPFGEGAGIDQLLVHVHLGGEASQGVWPVEMSRLRRVRKREWVIFALIALIPLIAFVIAIVTRPK